MKDPKNPKPGDVYGRLTLVEKLGPTKHGHAVWRCSCSCGAETFPTMPSLRRGNTKSCGCLRSDRAKEREAKRRAGLIPTTPPRVTSKLINTERFREIIAAKHYKTLEGTALEIGVHVNTVKSWRMPGARGRYETIVKVANALRVDPSELIEKEVVT